MIFVVAKEITFFFIQHHFFIQHDLQNMYNGSLFITKGNFAKVHFYGASFPTWFQSFVARIFVWTKYQQVGDLKLPQSNLIQALFLLH